MNAAERQRGDEVFSWLRELRARFFRGDDRFVEVPDFHPVGAYRWGVERFVAMHGDELYLELSENPTWLGTMHAMRGGKAIGGMYRRGIADTRPMFARITNGKNRELPGQLSMFSVVVVVLVGLLGGKREGIDSP